MTSKIINGRETFIAPKRKDTTSIAPLRKPPALAANFPDSQARMSSVFTFTGVTPQSTETVRRVLTENDHGYDMWERERRCSSPPPYLY